MSNRPGEPPGDTRPISVTVPPVISWSGLIPGGELITPLFRAVSVTSFVPAFKPATSIEPPVTLTGSLKIEVLISTAPVPAAVSPTVIDVNPS